MKTCIAGSFDSKYLDEYDDNSLNILQTFWDFKNPKKNKEFENILKKTKFFILDSGAFSMLYGKAKVDIDAYVNNYINFINKHDIEYFIELDMYDVLGRKKTEQLREKLETKTNKKCIPVFHRSQKLDYFIELTKKYNYIGLGGIARGTKIPINVMAKLLFIAKKNNCKVHGLGYTSIKNLKKLKFYSVDSTTWLAPIKFGGRIDVFKDGLIQKIDAPKNTRMITSKVRLHQLREWIKFQKFTEKNY